MPKKRNDNPFGTGGGEDVPFKELPNNIEAEQAMLGALLVNNRCFDMLPSELVPADFFEPLHRQIYEACVNLIKAEKIANPVTVKDYIPVPTDPEFKLSQYLANLAGNAVTIINAADYARAIMQLARCRETIGLSEVVEQIGFDGADELAFLNRIDELRDRLDDVIRRTRGEQNRRRTLAEAADHALDLTADAMSGKGVVGIDHGFAPLMSLIGPLIPGHLIVVGGATKQGKSSLIEQIIAGAAANGHHIWVYSGEMSAEELAARALSRLTDIQAWRQVQGRISEPEYDKLFSAGRSARKWMDHIHVEDKSMTLSQIDREIARFKKRYPSCLAVVDHVGLVERDKNSFRMSEAEFGPVATQSLKMTARKSEVPIIAAAQLKKNTFVQDGRTTKDTFFQAISRRPKYTDLIGACEKDANHVIIPFRAEPILQELEPAEKSDLHPAWEDVMDRVRGKAEIRLALSRHRNWPQSREVAWNGPRTSFEEKNQSDQARMPV